MPRLRAGGPRSPSRNRPIRRLLPAILLAFVLTAAPAQAHDGQGGACGSTVNAEWVRCQHHAHGHHQWQNGRGSEGHSWAFYRIQARWVRYYLLRVYLARLAAAAIPNESRWDAVAACESGGNWAISTGNGYFGGLQFSLGTWHAYGGQGYPHQQSKRDQILVAERVRTQSGLHHWPVCGARW